MRSTTELPRLLKTARWWGGRDSNSLSLRRQIYSLVRLAIVAASPHGAGNGTRTRNLLITNQLLYQLSYASG